MTTIQKMNPVNKESEKKKFLFDTNYNPQFVYEERISDREREAFGHVSATYVPQAEKILQSVLTTWKTERAFLAAAEGEIMTRDQIMRATTTYLQENSLEKRVQVRFVPGAVSPASMEGNFLNIRLPIGQRSLRFQGTLDHEIGTHFFRRINDEQQPWHKDRITLGFHPYLLAEEGLAVLHSHLTLEHKQMWFTALYYVAVYQASLSSFVDLYKYLARYIDDPDRRWNIAVRAKRGLSDTSQPGAIAKDQVYLAGVVSVLKWLDSHDYRASELYVGKIAIEDLTHARRISPDFVPTLPLFLQPERRDWYVAAIKEIRKQNGL